MKSEIVGFVFKCINFSIFSGIAYYLFRVYFIPSIKTRIQEQEKKHHQQHDHEQGLEQEALVIESRIQAQKKHAEYLIHQANAWSDKVDQWHKHREQERKRCKMLALERVKKVQGGMKQEYLMKAIIPGALAQLKHESMRYYENTMHVHAAFDTITRTLERKLS
ncbi:hypothetical protein KJZ61_00525 [Candidatus Dependentiae bacterium]|nr:hypothetical protein [Candidatus Dependentiae bacterium]